MLSEQIGQNNFSDFADLNLYFIENYFPDLFAFKSNNETPKIKDIKNSCNFTVFLLNIGDVYICGEN
jgi:hypothetical protein